MRAYAAAALLGVALAVPATGALAGSGAPAQHAVAQPEAVTVHVKRPSGMRASVRVSFRVRSRLPAGGYYYAVLALRPYRHHTRAAPPSCATSSDMQRVAYGYPRADGTVQLALAPARSRAGGWCPGGTYSGAVYAVPHAPPCEGRYPCRSEPYEAPSPCFELSDHHVVCGVVVRPIGWAYPDGDPAPVYRGTRIVGRFSVSFP